MAVPEWDWSWYRLAPKDVEMTLSKKPSPFKVGDWVIYRPSDKTLGYTTMSAEQLVVGQKYRVAEIQKDSCVVVEGYRDSGGGLYWTNFEPG